MKNYHFESIGYSNRFRRFVCVCVRVIANLCNGILLKIVGPCEGKNTLILVRESSDFKENSSMANVLQSKVKTKKKVLLIAIFSQSFLSIMRSSLNGLTQV